MIHEPRWKHIHSFCFLYEVSEEGQVRNRNTLTIKPQKWLTNGAPVVALGIARHRSLRIPVAHLLDQYWPEVEYPNYWRMEKQKKTDAMLERFELLEIMDSEELPIDIYRSGRYAVSRKTIARARLFQSKLGKELLEKGRDALNAREAIYWLDSKKRGKRIRSVLQGEPLVDDAQRNKGRRGILR